MKLDCLPKVIHNSVSELDLKRDAIEIALKEVLHNFLNENGAIYNLRINTDSTDPEYYKRKGIRKDYFKGETEIVVGDRIELPRSTTLNIIIIKHNKSKLDSDRKSLAENGCKEVYYHSPKGR